MRADQYEMLTPTEREVLRRLAGGSRPGEIARQLERSVSTVNNHLHSARTKLGVSDSLSAARALLAFEADGQRLPGHDLPIAPPPPSAPVPSPQRPETWSPTLLNEERVRFEHAPPYDAGPWPAGGGRDRWSTGWRKVAAMFCITLLALACIALAPAMAETCQLVANLLYPLHH